MSYSADDLKILAALRQIMCAAGVIERNIRHGCEETQALEMTQVVRQALERIETADLSRRLEIACCVDD